MGAVHLRRVLPDTNVWLWMLGDPDRLGPEATTLLADPDSELVFSAVCAWEAAVKLRIGKLAIDGGLERLLSRIGQITSQSLGVTLEHVQTLNKLPLHHRDPFDRMLVAQAKTASLVLVTADANQRAYDVVTVDATR